MQKTHQKKLKEELKSSWFIPLRLSIFLLLFGAVVLSDSSQAHLFKPFLLYSIATLAFLIIIQLESRLVGPKVFKFIILTHFVFELGVEGAIIIGAGQLTTQYSVMFLLTIVSASLVFRLMGTLSVATLASLTYAFTSAMNRFHQDTTAIDLSQLRQVYQVNDDVFYAIFLHICTFYVVAFISGFLAEKLRLKEGELTHTSKELERVQLDTDDILLNLHSGLITIDSRGRIVYFNRAAESILGMRQLDVKGKSFLEVFNRVMPDLCERVLSVLKLSKPSLRSELEIVNKNGERIPIGLTASMLGDARVGVRGVVAIFQDLTVAKQLEDALLRSNRLAAVGELSARIAHEIRNPLASISGSVEVLKSEISVDGENARLMELIVKESDRLSRILSDFLAYARTGPSRSTKVELVSTVSDTIDLIRHHTQLGQQGQIEFKSDQSTVYIIADEDQLKQILLNVFTNSLEAVAGRQGNVVAEISASVTGEGMSATEWVSLRIRDNGCGLAAEDKERIFEPFFSRKKGGTGLGLAIVKRCLDNIGARISVESKAGVGTTFDISFRRYLLQREAGDSIPAQSISHTPQKVS